MKIELTDRETLFLSDTLGGLQDDIRDELAEIESDIELDNIVHEMKEDLVICRSVWEKLQIPETAEDTPQ
jgi:hypothetical protein